MCIYNNICSFITDKGLLFDITSCLSNKEIKIFLNCNKDLHKFKKYFVKKIELNEDSSKNFILFDNFNKYICNLINDKTKIFLNFNSYYSELYINNNSFNTLVLSKITKKQLSLSFTAYYIENIININGINKLSINCCTGLQNISAINDVNILILNCCTLIDNLSFISNIDKLVLKRCMNIKNLLTLNNVPDLTELVICGCTNITNISYLTNLKKLNTLTLCGCIKLIKIPPIKIDNLNLNNCNMEIDTSNINFKIKNYSDVCDYHSLYVNIYV